MKILAVIPVFNSWMKVPSLVEAVRRQGLDVCIVDDGSTMSPDLSFLRVKAVLLRHSVNRGKGAALRTAFSFALEQGYEGVVTLDSDGQHSPGDIPRFLEAALDNKFVVGKRDFCHPSMPLLRKMSNRITSYLLSHLLGRPIADAQCGFRFIHRDVLSRVVTEKEGFEMESEMIIKACREGYPPVFIPVKTIYSGEKSAIKGFRDTSAFIRLYFKALFKGL